MVLDYAISAQKYPKIVTQEKENFKESATVFFKTMFFDVVFHMFMCVNETFNQNKNCSLDKTGEGNVVSDLAISAQKYPKIVTQEKEKCQGIRDSVFQNYVFFYGVLTSFFTCLCA